MNAVNQEFKMSEIVSDLETGGNCHEMKTTGPARQASMSSLRPNVEAISISSEGLPSAMNTELWYVDMNKNHKRESVVSESPSVGWMNVKRRLGTLAAVKTVMDSTKKNRNKKPVEQKDFLEKFSTREYTTAKTGKKSSAIIPSRRVSVVNNFINTAIEETPANVSQNHRNSENDKKPVNTIITEEFCDPDIEEKESFCKSLWYMTIEPHGNFLYFWLFIVITAIHYNAWVVFLRIAFSKAQKDFETLWFVLDSIADFIYVMDFIIYLRLSFLEDGIYVDNLWRLALTYVKSYPFCFDLGSIIPLDFLYLIIGIRPSLRLLRLLKYYKVFMSQKTILSLSSYPNIIRTFFFLHIMLIMMHWNACFYFMVSEYEGFGINHWVYPNLTSYNSRLIHQYALCYYWSTLSLTTIGGSHHPVTTIECTYMIVCYAVGIFIFATIVGQAGNVIQNMNAGRIEFEKQRDSTMQYMKRHNVPSEVQRRVRLWYDYSYSRGRFQGDSDINDIVLLPNKMKTELALHVHLETLRRVTFLQKCQPEFLHDLVLKMKMLIFTPGDYICRKGEVAREMYVISNGVLEVLSETGRILKVLHSGDFFGEIGILSLSKGQNKRTADVRAYGYVELFVLSKDDVLNAIKEYPDTQKILSKYGRNRLKKDTASQGGPRSDTTSESDDDQESVYLNLNSSTGLANLNEDVGRKRSDSRRSSFHRNSIRKDNEARRGSILKIPVPVEKDSKPSMLTKVLPISDKFTHSHSVLQGAMMSAINPAMQPASTFVAGIRSPTLEKRSSELKSMKLEKRLSGLSVVVNNEVDDKDKDTDVNTNDKHQSPGRRSRKNKSIDTEELIEIMQTNHEDLLNNMKALFRKKMTKNQKKFLDQIRELEQVNEEKEKEIRSLMEEIYRLKHMHYEEKMKNNELRYDSFTNDADSVTATIEDKGSKQNVRTSATFSKRKSKSISPKKTVEQMEMLARSKSATSVLERVGTT